MVRRSAVFREDGFGLGAGDGCGCLWVAWSLAERGNDVDGSDDRVWSGAGEKVRGGRTCFGQSACRCWVGRTCVLDGRHHTCDYCRVRRSCAGLVVIDRDAGVGGNTVLLLIGERTVLRRAI